MNNILEKIKKRWKLITLVILMMFLTSSVAAQIISNVLQGQSKIAMPNIEVVNPCSGCGDGNILPNPAGLNTEYISTIKIDLEAGTIDNVQIVLIFQSSGITFEPSDVDVKVCHGAGCTGFVPATCDVENNDLVCRYNIGTLNAGSTKYRISVKITDPGWVDKSFIWLLRLEVGA